MSNSTDDGRPAIFHFVMIKPTHYDDDGYPIQWLRSAIPSNTLACLNDDLAVARRKQLRRRVVIEFIHDQLQTCRQRRND